jgi:sugar/nucleoside kinase (ribokinase family)
MDLDILCIGPAGFDIFISGKDLKPNKLLIENSITLENNTSYDIDHSVYEAGGAGLNASIVFARQGIAAGCMAKTGKDHLANQIKIIAKHENIETDTFINKPEHHTDMNIHIVTNRTDEIRLAYENSNNSLRPKEVKLPKLQSKMIYFAELPDDFKIFKYYASWAKINKSKLVVNITDFKKYKKRHINYIISTSSTVMIKKQLAIDYWNIEEGDLGSIEAVNNFGANSIVMYDVIDKAYAFENGTLYMSGPYKKTNPLDLTGADDVFAAGYISAIFSQKSVPEALTLASANACSVMDIFGTRTGILKKPALRTMKVETRTL